MITENVQNLFQFINFLHSNTDYFLSKKPLIDKVLNLNETRRALKPDDNYKDRIEYNKIQVEIKKAFSEAEKQTTKLIKEKIQEFDIANVSTPIINLNAKDDLYDLRGNFSEEDLPLILDARKNYVDFRTKTNSHYFLQFFFDELDRDLSQFFNYFKDEPTNEFQPFKRKTVNVDSMIDAIHHLQNGKEVSISLEVLTRPVQGYAERSGYLNVADKQTSKVAFEIFQKEYQKLREKFRIKKKATKEDCKQMPGLTEGAEIEYEPDYKTSIEAFELLKKYYAAICFELEKQFFVEKYKVWNEATINAEKNEVEKFIKAANNESLSDASEAFANKWNDKPEFIYLRLKSGFYEHLEIERYPLISSIGNEEARIYGRYFLFYEFLKQQQKAYSQYEEVESLDQLIGLFETQKTVNDFEPLKSYIREKYLNVHPNKLTLESLEQIKRNISTWKLKLKDLNEATELQDFISEVIEDINLKIGRFGANKMETEGEFSYVEKRVKDFTQTFEQYGFFSLQKVKQLSKEGQAQLIYLIASNQLPYCIAMFHFLGFLEQLGNGYFKTKTDLQIEVSKWFDADKQGRTVAANIRVLSPVSNEDRSRYTAHLHKETVKNHYEKLK